MPDSLVFKLKIMNGIVIPKEMIIIELIQN